jgi:CRP/FNR family nitrogen fixation transcriptional regulator
MTAEGRSIAPSSWLQHPPATCRRDPFEAVASLAVTTRWSRGQEICSQEGEAAYWYRVSSGMARRYAIRPSGRRQIVGLLLPGDFFGFPIPGGSFAVEAVIEGTQLACYPRRRVELLADSDPSLAREIRGMSFRAIGQLQEQILILGRTTALKKVGSFLLTLAERLSGGRQAGRVVLPMSRYDTADYLGLSVETVCRSLTELKHRGIIKLSGTRRITILDPEALEGGVRSESTTRGDAMEAALRRRVARRCSPSPGSQPAATPADASVAHVAGGEDGVPHSAARRGSLPLPCSGGTMKSPSGLAVTDTVSPSRTVPARIIWASGFCSSC